MPPELRPLSDEDIARRIASTHDYCARQQVGRAIHAAQLAHTIVDEIIAHIRPGIRESQVREFAQERFTHHGIERTWHPPYVRFGAHTLLTFLDKADEDRMLLPDDIAFVDIGIVKDGIEGDAGRTVAFGRELVMHTVAEASKTIFDAARQFWSSTNPTGIALYEFIYAQAEKAGLCWNLDPAGHLIGAFPHRGWKRGINHFPDTVAPGTWILEIQLRHPQLPIGSFFEDVLY